MINEGHITDISAEIKKLPERRIQRITTAAAERRDRLDNLRLVRELEEAYLTHAMPNTKRALENGVKYITASWDNGLKLVIIGPRTYSF